MSTLIKKAEIIQWDSERCPLGIPLPQGCHFAGSSVLQMKPGQTKANRKIYNETRNHSQCAYADQLFEKEQAVNCMALDAAGANKVPHLYRGQAYFPNIFAGFSGSYSISLDPSYHTYSSEASYSLNF